jgi:hypothetical protein
MRLLSEIFTRFTLKYPQFTWHFSTPSRFTAALHKENLLMPVKYDDFMPFADNPELGLYWVGYFSSRPNLKSMIRQLTVVNSQANKLLSMNLVEEMARASRSAN